MAAINAVLTDAGMAAVSAADALGLSVVIHSVAIGAGQMDVHDAGGDPVDAALEATALLDERKRANNLTGGPGSPGQVKITALFPSDENETPFNVYELGFFDENGTLIYYWSTTGTMYGAYGGFSTYRVSATIALTNLPSGAITVNVADALTAEQILRLEQNEDKVRGAVEAAGLVFDETDATQLDQAIALIAAGSVQTAQVERPNITYPAEGQTDIQSRPTIVGSAYFSLYGVAQAAIQLQVSTAADFATTVFDSTAGAATSLEVVSGTLAVSTLYHARLRYQDTRGRWSDWSPPVSFSTAATFQGVEQPVITSPVNGADDAPTLLTITTSDFAVIGGGGDTHNLTDWQVDVAGGDFSAPVWESLNDAANLVSVTVSPSALSPLTEYKLRARHHGQLNGWSQWSAPTTVTTIHPSATLLFDEAGSHQFTVPAGVTTVQVTTQGAGGGSAASGNDADDGEDGYDGETSSFGAHCSATGGKGGKGGIGNGASGAGGAGGQGVGGDQNLTGGAGSASSYDYAQGAGTDDGGAALGGIAPGETLYPPRGNGADGPAATNSAGYGGGGGAGGRAIKIVSVNPGDTITVTVGEGGDPGVYVPTPATSGTKGPDGFVEIKYGEGIQ